MEHVVVGRADPQVLGGIQQAVAVGVAPDADVIDVRGLVFERVAAVDRRRDPAVELEAGPLGRALVHLKGQLGDRLILGVLRKIRRHRGHGIAQRVDAVRIPGNQLELVGRGLHRDVGRRDRVEGNAVDIGEGGDLAVAELRADAAAGVHAHVVREIHVGRRAEIVGDEVGARRRGHETVERGIDDVDRRGMRIAGWKHRLADLDVPVEHAVARQRAHRRPRRLHVKVEPHARDVVVRSRAMVLHLDLIQGAVEGVGPHLKLQEAHPDGALADVVISGEVLAHRLPPGRGRLGHHVNLRRLALDRGGGRADREAVEGHADLAAGHGDIRRIEDLKPEDRRQIAGRVAGRRQAHGQEEELGGRAQRHRRGRARRQDQVERRLAERRVAETPGVVAAGSAVVGRAGDEDIAAVAGLGIGRVELRIGRGRIVEVERYFLDARGVEGVQLHQSRLDVGARGHLQSREGRRQAAAAGDVDGQAQHGHRVGRGLDHAVALV